MIGMQQHFEEDIFFIISGCEKAFLAPYCLRSYWWCLYSYLNASTGSSLAAFFAG
jgi:hypothetical protein